jgi:hypothetical protein
MRKIPNERLVQRSCRMVFLCRRPTINKNDTIGHPALRGRRTAIISGMTDQFKDSKVAQRQTKTYSFVGQMKFTP